MRAVREAAKGRAVTEPQVPEWVPVAGSPGRPGAAPQPGPRKHSPLHARGQDAVCVRDAAARGASVRVDGAKRLRRSRWERGTCERVARGRVSRGDAWRAGSFNPIRKNSGASPLSVAVQARP